MTCRTRAIAGGCFVAAAAVTALSCVGAKGSEAKAAECASLLAVPCQEGFADSSGVKIHYVTAGDGPLIVMVHGYPEFWYIWRKQVEFLAKNKFTAVAIDTRGYNLSDKPEGVENYKHDKLSADIAAVIKHFKRDKATLIGTDWGGLQVWHFAMHYPQMTERAVFVQLPHPQGYKREMAIDPRMGGNTRYARNFQQPDAASKVDIQKMLERFTDPDERKAHEQFYKRTSWESMMNYYKANFPYPPYTVDMEGFGFAGKDFPKVKAPVLMVYGLQSPGVLNGPMLNGTWDWIDNELTVMVFPEVRDFRVTEAELFNTRLLHWITRWTAPDAPKVGVGRDR